MSSVKKLCLSALCIALCCVLPTAFHGFGLGAALSPMHLPVLLCGLICGWWPGAVCGLIGPILSSVLTGMPASAQLLHMVPELVTYGLFAGLLILQVRYSFLLAVLIAILDFLPMFGTGTALIPWAAVELITGEYASGAGLLLLYLLTQAVRQLIQPKIVGDSMGLPPLTTLILLFLGYKFRGIAGMILAVPIGMVFIKFYEYGAFDSLIANAKLLVREIGKLMKEE